MDIRVILSKMRWLTEAVVGRNYFVAGWKYKEYDQEVWNRDVEYNLWIGFARATLTTDRNETVNLPRNWGFVL